MNVTVWNDFRPSLHPCAIESFDIPSEASSYRSSFLCGQYELDETNVGGPTRGGSIIACTVDSKSKELSWTTTDCQSGVLDMKVSGNFVASAQSDHSLFLHKIQHGDVDICPNDDVSESMPKDKLVEVTSVSAAEEGLFLSVDWDLGFALHDIPSGEDKEFKDCYGETKCCRQEKVSRRCSMNLNCTSPANITVSTQQGSVIVYQLNNQNEFSEILHINNAHVMLGECMPVWITCFDPHSKNTLVTGGDDCMMKLWDLRQGDQPTHNNKVHNAGVTSAQWHPVDEHVFASGSYDENLRVWDHRAMRSPISEIHVGNGWKSKSINILQYCDQNIQSI